MNARGPTGEPAFCATLAPLARLRFRAACLWLRARSALRLGHPTHITGLFGEAAAEALLVSRGYRVLARRARVPMGEADLVCTAPGQPPAIVIVEVKTRETTAADGPFQRAAGEAALTPDKLRILRAVAHHLRRANGWHDRPLRIDGVAVDTCRGRVVAARHYAGIG